MALKALKQPKKAENAISSILLKFSRWVPLNKVILSHLISSHLILFAHSEQHMKIRHLSFATQKTGAKKFVQLENYPPIPKETIQETLCGLFDLNHLTSNRL